MLKDLQKTLFALLIMLSAHASVAQFHWGVRTGFQYSTLHFNTADDWNSWKSSYVIPGFFGQYNFNEKFAVSADILFAKKGFKWEAPVLASNDIEYVKYDYNLSYLSFPVMFHASPVQKFSVFAGPEFGVKLYSSVIINGESKQHKGVFDNKFDFGVAGGFAVELFPGYSFMLRYTHGLANVLGKNVQVWNNGMYVNARDLGYKFSNQAIQLLFSSVLTVPKNEKRTGASFGIRQGISRSTLHGSGITELDEPVKNRIGYEAGLEVKFNIKKYFYVSTGLSYLQMGGEVKGDNPVKLNYLSVPIIIGISPIKTREFTFSIEGGTMVNKLVKSINPYEFDDPFNTDSQYSQSLLYGFEVSTDAINGKTLFLNYRNIVANEFYETENYQYITKSRSISVGVRLRNEPKPKPVREEGIERPFFFGLKGGINLNHTAYSNLPNGYTVDSQNPIGFHIGMFFGIRLSEKFAFIPELQYIQKSKYLKSIETPLILSYKVNDLVSVEAGPQVGVLLNSKNRKFENSIEEYYSKVMDLGWNGGLHFSVSDKLSVACRYYHGSKDILAWYENGLRISTEGYNRNIQVSTYYTLSSKR